MKKASIVFLALALVACKSEQEEKQQVSLNRAESTEVSTVELGKQLFDGRGNCKSCHMPDQKVIGPSIIEIAKIYKEQNGDMVAFLREKADPIVDPSQYPAMKVNLGVTKRMSIEEVEAIEAYMMSFIDASN